MLRRFTIVLLTVAFAATVSGCSLLGEDEPETQDVSDFSGLFHFQVPANWQAVSEAGVAAVYAGSELPETDNVIDTLSILALSNPLNDEIAPEELLPEFIEARSIQRAWGEPEIGEVQDATIGGRPAVRVDAEATDATGVRFSSRFYLHRAGNNDILVVTVVPVDRADEFDDDIEAALENWFWHTPASDEATADDEG